MFSLVPSLFQPTALGGEHSEPATAESVLCAYVCAYEYALYSLRLEAGRGRGDGWKQEEEGHLTNMLSPHFMSCSLG